MDRKTVWLASVEYGRLVEGHAAQDEKPDKKAGAGLKTKDFLCLGRETVSLGDQKKGAMMSVLYKQCKSCIYRGRIKDDLMYCNYSVTSRRGAALKKINSSKIIDTRGGDPDNCLLYVKGRQLKA